MANVLLIAANNYKDPYPVYPLGVAYLSKYLKTHLPNDIISEFDFNLQSYENLKSLLQKQTFDIIGISLRNIDDTNIFAKNSFIEHYKRINDIVRSLSKSKIILGGSGFSIFPEIIFQELNPDYAIHGEGEDSLLQLINAIKNQEDTQNIPGLVFYNKLSNSIKINEKGNYIDKPELEIGKNEAEYYWNESGMLNIQTKRGCPYNCIYCSYPIIDGKKVRTLEPQKVLENIIHLNKTLGINYLFFTDSIFNINNEYNNKLCNLIIDSKLNISWGAYFSPNNLTYEDLKLYKQAGLTHIEFGTDSLSDTQLRNYQKNFTFEDI
ncbi:cobalamin-dependent protein [Odoribacter sp. OttesenSCG-928-L07]|nr:cobalamin-dependent protein [Odoribacter sp. OttesenSCG-928-L07]MDL2238906.1 cobalamin-dependent protein [Bacteroidales bacterium OttesenSCG-928-L14]